MHTGFAIALAWPQTQCRQAGSWYDHLMMRIGFNQNHYYPVGHAAIVLIEAQSGECRYFDFGRYHTPAGYGRVRDVETDHDLIIRLPAHLDQKQNKILNLKKLLVELQSNEACHGAGNLMASITKIHFAKAFEYARKIQSKGVVPYGPFVWNGTNCSRFVRSVLLNAEVDWITRWKLQFPFTITPTPRFNVRCLDIKMQKYLPENISNTDIHSYTNIDAI